MQTGDDQRRTNLRQRAALPLLIFVIHVAVPASPVLAMMGAHWLAPRPATRQPIEDPDGRALFSFHQALAQTLARGKNGEGAAITRIIHYGDSHVAADLMTGALRGYFQRDFGQAGPGFILAGRPWPWYRPSEVESGASAGWQVNGLGQAALASDGEYGLAGLSLSTERAGERLWLATACERFVFYLLKQPGGGAVEVLLDGGTVHYSVSLASPQAEAAYLEVEAGDDRPHLIELRTVRPGRVRVFGVVAERNQSGVVYDALGINGARATRPLAWDWQILASNLRRRDPDLIIVAYGSNEVGDVDLDLIEYGREFSELLRRLRGAAPRASLLVIAPPDRGVREGRRWRTMRAMPGLVAVQRQAALEAGAAFWDLFHAMGGGGSIEGWARRSEPLAQPDRVHLTRFGYQSVAEMLYPELMGGFLQSVWQTIRNEWELHWEKPLSK